MCTEAAEFGYTKRSRAWWGRCGDKTIRHCINHNNEFYFVNSQESRTRPDQSLRYRNSAWHSRLQERAHADHYELGRLSVFRHDKYRRLHGRQAERQCSHQHLHRQNVHGLWFQLALLFICNEKEFHYYTKCFQSKLRIKILNAQKHLQGRSNVSSRLP